jgi:prohibitin 1
MFTVGAGHRAIIWDRGDGLKDEVKGEGSFLLIPFWQQAFHFDVRTRPKTINTETGSKDLQNVNISLRILFRPNESKLPEIYDKLGPDYDERVLPIGKEVLKAVVAQYDAVELITQREVVSREIREALTDRSRSFNIILEDVAITHLGFSDEFTRAIEHKQVAQQEAERARYLVEKADQEAKAAIIRAEGESEAARLITQATMKTGPAFLELRRLEAAKEVADTLTKSKNITFLPSNSNVFIQPRS